jgi:hypothetical protein
MLIINKADSIVLSISVEEANVLQHALSLYRGPFPDTELSNYFDKEHHAKCLSSANSMLEAIQDELMDRYHGEIMDKQYREKGTHHGPTD